MANTLDNRNIRQAVLAPSDYPPIPGIEEMSKEELDSHGYYKGYPCLHNHVIREKTKHWCYHCAQKIRSNICGFDVNYLNSDCKHQYARIWKQIPVGHAEDCWEAPGVARGRYGLPSYRNLTTDKTNNNQTVHKLIYQCAWGDVGSMRVTRTCGNKNCLNPLHLITSWNRVFPPGKIYPFFPEFEYEKLMAYSEACRRGVPTLLTEREYKPTIQHPLVHKNTPDYD